MKETQVDWLIRVCPEGFIFWGPWPKDQVDTVYFRHWYGSDAYQIVDEYVDLDGNIDPNSVSLFRRKP